MSDSDNRAVIQAWADALSAGDLDAAVSHLAPDFVGHFSSMPEPVHGPDGFAGMFGYFIKPAFPDQKFTLERFVHAPDGERLALQMTWTATQGGPFLGVPPTGKTVEVHGTGIFRIVGGKIVEEWMLEDFLGIYQQITEDKKTWNGGDLAPKDAPSGGPEANTAILQRYYDLVLNQGDLAAVDQLITADYESHHNDPAGLPAGPAGVKAFVSMTRGGFPDLVLTVDQMFAEGDFVASMWTMEGNQTGDWFGAPASGRHARWWGVAITRFEGDQIAEDWYNFDQVSLLQQVGIIPAG